ncbi:MAG TPA: iron ABC transporter substrate-binding protein, partial [Thermosynergistes sp.]|nr:iron ABC transporter substrate-binding protein [Thermosynergistes sp.]
MRWVKVLAVIAVLFGAFCSAAPAGAIEQELYPGEKELHEAALKEGALYSYDTGPTWANWQGLFDAFKQRYGIEVTWNDLGSGATVVRLEKENNNPQADTAYYFMPFGALAKERGVTEGFKPVNFDKIPDLLKDP